MSSCIDIHVPHETVNDDFVIIVEWHVPQGEQVTVGQTIVSIETSKMVIDVEASADGYLEIIEPATAEVAVGDLIGRINADKPSDAAPVAPDHNSPAEQPNSASTPSDVKISKKAQALIDQYEISATAFEGAGLVKEADVIHYLEKLQEGGTLENTKDSPANSSSQSSDSQTQESTALTETTSQEAVTQEYSRGLFSDAAKSANERGKSIFVLAWNYVFFNWFLGNLIRWAPRGIILPLHRLRGVRMGKGCFIDPTSIVETAYPENITLGNDVRITAGAVIMTHIKAPHYLRETGIMPAVVKPVTLEDHCFIGVNSVVMPGVTVGKAAVVASGAVVMQNVPPYTMVSGNPAKVIKTFPQPD